MSCSHPAAQSRHSHSTAGQYGREMSSGREGHVGGFRSAAVQGHIAAHLAAAAAGA